MTFFELPMWMVLPFLFILGAVIGSFLNVCIYRIPQHETMWGALQGLVSPPSSCPSCKNRILPRDNIPILGWILLGGRCRFCKQSFSIRYAAIEFLNGALFVLVFWMEVGGYGREGFEQSSLFTPMGPLGVGLTGNATSIAYDWLMLWRYFYHMVMVEALLVATFIDFDLQIIPDSVTLPAMLVGVAGAGIFGQFFLVPIWYQHGDLQGFIALLFDAWMDSPPPAWIKNMAGFWWMSGSGIPTWCTNAPHLHGFAVSLTGLLVGGGTVWVVRILGQSVLRQEAMGFGDVVLMAMIGSFLGWQPTIIVFVLAPAIALLVVAATWLFAPNRVIPYGPYLSLSALVVILSWRWLWVFFERIFDLGPLLPFLAVFMAVSLYLLLHLTQFVKWCLGMELYPPDEIYEEWTSADQLTYLSMEQVDPRQGQWKGLEWPGVAAGKGQLPAATWNQEQQTIPRSGWQQHWQRRSNL